MAKKKAQPTSLKRKAPNTVKIDVFALERKIRRPSLPSSKLHKNKKVYSRKSKHPKNSDE
ncbi:MAG: hypothetical protein PHC70_02965 [Patescibacteria group bacterium]|nr:hypothetical protein [Patescibacteria group bacterium]